MIRAAIFDVFGTVVDWRSGVAAVARRGFAAKGVTVDAEAFADAWRGEYQPAMERVRSGRRGYVALDDLHLENLERVLDRLGHGVLFSADERAELNRAWEELPPWPDSVAGIAAIRRQLIVAPCSNGSIALMVRLARFAGLSWDCILGAEVAQAYKPSAAAYRRSVEALRLEPGEVAMVAAHNDDLRAARSLGLATAFVPRPAEHGPGQRSDLEPAEDWDFVAADMEALAALLAEGAR